MINYSVIMIQVYAVVFIYIMIFATIKMGAACKAPDQGVIKKQYYQNLATFVSVFAWIACGAYVIFSAINPNILKLSLGTLYTFITLLFTWSVAKA